MVINPTCLWKNSTNILIFRIEYKYLICILFSCKFDLFRWRLFYNVALVFYYVSGFVDCLDESFGCLACFLEGVILCCCLLASWFYLSFWTFLDHLFFGSPWFEVDSLVDLFDQLLGGAGLLFSWELAKFWVIQIAIFISLAWFRWRLSKSNISIIFCMAIFHIINFLPYRPFIKLLVLKCGLVKRRYGFFV
jgi:hypothetical protein